MTCTNNQHSWIFDIDDGSPTLMCAVEGCTIPGDVYTRTDGNVLILDYADALWARIPVHVRIKSRCVSLGIDAMWPYTHEFDEDITLTARPADEVARFTDERCSCCGQLGSFGSEQFPAPGPGESCGGQHQWVLALEPGCSPTLECAVERCAASHEHLLGEVDGIALLYLETVPVIPEIDYGDSDIDTACINLAAQPVAVTA